MKKLFITAIAAILFSVTAFAGDDDRKTTPGDVNVSYLALTHFKADFKKVKNATWTVTANCQKATFEWDGVTMTAFYDLSGAFLGVTHNIEYTAVPVNAQKEINSSYADYTTKSVIKFEYNGDNTTVDPLVYFVDLKKADKEIVLKVTPDEKVTFFKQVK
ncbi:MAG: hypothetical protein ACXVAY_19990 [Mucilaginibacter sp.]